MIPGTGHPVPIVSLCPGDDVHLASHDVAGTDLHGSPWHHYINCGDADVHVDRVRTEGPDLVALYWWLGSVRGVTMYGRTSLIPLIRRAA